MSLQEEAKAATQAATVAQQEAADATARATAAEESARAAAAAEASAKELAALAEIREKEAVATWRTQSDALVAGDARVLQAQEQAQQALLERDRARTDATAATSAAEAAAADAENLREALSEARAAALTARREAAEHERQAASATREAADARKEAQDATAAAAAAQAALTAREKGAGEATVELARLQEATEAATAALQQANSRAAQAEEAAATAATERDEAVSSAATLRRDAARLTLAVEAARRTASREAAQRVALERAHDTLREQLATAEQAVAAHRAEAANAAQAAAVGTSTVRAVKVHWRLREAQLEQHRAAASRLQQVVVDRAAAAAADGSTEDKPPQGVGEGKGADEALAEDASRDEDESAAVPAAPRMPSVLQEGVESLYSTLRCSPVATAATAAAELAVQLQGTAAELRRQVDAMSVEYSAEVPEPPVATEEGGSGDDHGEAGPVDAFSGVCSALASQVNKIQQGGCLWACCVAVHVHHKTVISFLPPGSPKPAAGRSAAIPTVRAVQCTEAIRERSPGRDCTPGGRGSQPCRL